MIGQNISLEYLVPLTVEHLKKDRYREGDFYPGDFLKMVLSADPKFWRDHPEWHNQVEKIAQMHAHQNRNQSVKPSAAGRDKIRKVRDR